MSQAPSCRWLHAPHPHTCGTGRQTLLSRSGQAGCTAGLYPPRRGMWWGPCGLFTCVMKRTTVLEVSATLSPGHIVLGPGRPPG